MTTAQTTPENDENIIEIPFDLVLIKPIAVTKDITVDVLTFNREPIASDFANMSPGGTKMGDLLNIISYCTAQPRKTVIDKLSAKDMFAAINVINHFLPNFQTTGDQA